MTIAYGPGSRVDCSHVSVRPCWSDAFCLGTCAPVPDGMGVCCMQSGSMLEPRPMQPLHGGGVLARGPKWRVSML